MKIPKISIQVKYIPLLVLYSSLAFQTGKINATELGYDETIPYKYPLFTVNYRENDQPESCHIDDFIKSCSYDGQCKTRKGLCGENLSSNFFTTQNWTKLNGQYQGNKGFDGFYSTNSSFSRYVIVEDKGGGSADFNPKNAQMSLEWQAETVEKLFRNNKIEATECTKFLEALANGCVISFFTRTLFKDNRTPSKDRRRLGHLVNVTPSFNELQIGTSERYTYRTEISLLGSPKWASPFQNTYIQNYQYDIHHRIFPRSLHCSLRVDGGYCLIQDATEFHNYSSLSNSLGSVVYFR